MINQETGFINVTFAEGSDGYNVSVENLTALQILDSTASLVAEVALGAGDEGQHSLVVEAFLEMLDSYIEDRLSEEGM